MLAGHNSGMEILSRIALGHDTRASSDFTKSSINSGLLLYPVTIHDACIIPTPALCHFVQHTDAFDCGIIISASHNPHYDNGIKIIAKHTGKLSQADEQLITTLFYEPVNHYYTTFGKCRAMAASQTALQRFYYYHVCTPNIAWKKNCSLDCAHGATSGIAPALFEQLGATVFHPTCQTPMALILISTNAALYTYNNYSVLFRREYAADIGFAFDGDGDRVIAINRYGQIKNGDDILALLLEHPTYAHN